MNSQSICLLVISYIVAFGGGVGAATTEDPDAAFGMSVVTFILVAGLNMVVYIK